MKEKTDYWKVRDAILRAIADEDDAALIEFAHTHPDIFQKLVNQAQNEAFKRKRHRK